MASAPPIPAPKGRRPKAPIPDINLLSVEEQLAIRQKATAQVDAEKKKVAEDALLAQALEEARRAGGVEEELVTFRLDLAEFADRLVIDSVHYFHGREYTVPRSKYDLMREMAARTWGHQMEIDGKKVSLLQPKNLQLSPHGIINTSNLMRV